MYKFHICSFIIITLLICACGNPKTITNTPDTISGKAPDKETSDKKKILIFGDSLTAGYGLDDPASQSYPSVVQAKLDSLKLPYKVINGGLSGETTAGGKGRIDWLLKQKIDIFVLELGANDGLRGIPTTETEKNLQAIIEKVKAKYPNAKLILTGMMVPPNMGSDYANEFKAIFPALAKKYNMAFVPFILQNVAGIKDLNQDDGIHPTARGAKIVAKNVWDVLKEEL